MGQQPETGGKYYLIKPAHISEVDMPAWVQEQMLRILDDKKAVENLLNLRTAVAKYGGEVLRNLKIEGGNDGK